jgi:hypothetical protein
MVTGTNKLIKKKRKKWGKEMRNKLYNVTFPRDFISK